MFKPLSPGTKPPPLVTPIKIRGEWFTIPKAYPKGASGQLVHDQLFIDELTQQTKKRIFMMLVDGT